MDYKEIAKVKEALTKSYYKQLNDLIIQGVTFFSAPNIIEYLSYCINDISLYYDEVIHGQAGAAVDSNVKDVLKNEKA